MPVPALDIEGGHGPVSFEEIRMSTDDIDIPRLKTLMRRRTIERILAMSPELRHREETELVARFPSLPGWITAGTVLLYANAFPEELDTEPLLQFALKSGKRVLCPRVHRRESRLRLFEIHNLASDFEAGILGIPEPRTTCPEVAPVEVDWVLVPGLAFDSQGFRLGRGAGHYDRLLPALRKDVPRWALIYESQWVEAVPVEPHDVALDGVVSASRVIRP